MKQKIRERIVWIICVYQNTISPDTGFLKKIGLIKKPVCVFYPSCSEYAKQAINKYGVFKGLYFGFHRILRCHPWQKQHIDHLK
jgi:putative membrane protein insertion efficiency factor